MNKIKTLMARMDAEDLTEQKKIEMIPEILELAKELANDAQLNGNIALSTEVLDIVNNVTEILSGILQTSSADVKVVGAVADVSKTSAQITQTVADTAGAAGSTELAGQVLNTVNKITDNLSGLIRAPAADANIITAVADVSKTSAQIAQTVVADTAGAAGISPELAGQALNTVDKIADNLSAIMQVSAADADAVSAVADVSKTAAQITQTVADAAKDADNQELAQQAVTVAGELKAVTHQVAVAAQQITATSTDENTVSTAEIIIQEVQDTENLLQSAVDVSVQAGASPPPAPSAGTPQAVTADPVQILDVQMDEPISDNKAASPN
ncbi:MAG: hypothetical protein V2I97_19790 [Desulfococcaceae bacterium]|nr:hypothetical protein [Desulfococcaceae bacterium]